MFAFVVCVFALVTAALCFALVIDLAVQIMSD